MTDQRYFTDRSAPSVSVVDRDIPDETWQAVALDLARSEGPSRPAASETSRRWGASISTTRSWSALPSEPLAAPRSPNADRPHSEPPQGPPRRVPIADIVMIGRKDRPSTSPQTGKRRVWRELFFLGILATTVYGAYHSGRVTGTQKVIVIPIPESRQSRIT